jgi:tryptophan-rich sensory protein
MLKPKQIMKLVVALVVCFGVSGVGAVFTTQDSISNWYGQLTKPFLTPPNWIFGPVWSALYLLMAISFFIVWSKGINYFKVKQAMVLFVIQLVLNAAWTPLFFGFRLILPAFIDIILLWLVILVTLYVFKHISLYAAVILIPYVAWVGFAVILNGSIWYLNK